MSDKEFDTEYTNEIKCPHCGYEFEDSWEFNDENSEYIRCRANGCEKEFKLYVHIDVSYSTYE